MQEKHNINTANKSIESVAEFTYMRTKHNINTANKSIESVAEFTYMRTKLGNKIACMKKPRTN